MTDNTQNPAVSPKGFVAMLLLCIFLGSFGAHRFYVGKPVTAVLMLLTLGGLGIWVIIDLVYIAVGRFEDKDGLQIKPS